MRLRSHPFSDLQAAHEQLSTNGLRSRTENREMRATAEPDLDGRTVRGLQSVHRALSETYRDKTSDLANLGLEHAQGAWMITHR